MKAWLASLEQRERRLVLIGAALLIVMLIYVAMWEPLVSNVENLRSSTAEQRSVLLWMQQAAQEVRQLSGASGARINPTSGQSLLSLVDRTAKSGKLGLALKRVQPDGEQRVRVWMEGAAFDDIVSWLVQLETRYGVRIDDSVFEVKEEAGRVDARLVFEGAG